MDQLEGFVLYFPSLYIVAASKSDDSPGIAKFSFNFNLVWSWDSFDVKFYTPHTHQSGNKSRKQAGAELCQAQHSLSLDLDTN